jgi:hypothetical protein
VNVAVDHMDEILNINFSRMERAQHTSTSAADLYVRLSELNAELMRADYIDNTQRMFAVKARVRDQIAQVEAELAATEVRNDH